MANINVLKNYIKEEREVVCKYLNDDNEVTTAIGLPTHLSENGRELFINGSEGLEHGVDTENIIYIEA